MTAGQPIPPPVVMVRQTGSHGSELYLRGADGVPHLIDLTEDQLRRIAGECMAGLERAAAERKLKQRGKT